MTDPRTVSINDYTYYLPADRIALAPMTARDGSKLLQYNNDGISEHSFTEIKELLPEGTRLVFNDTKVINARLKFRKESGSSIEIFCLEPADMAGDYTTAMGAQGSAVWKCFVGGASKWKEDFLSKEFNVNGNAGQLQVNKLAGLPEAFNIRFSWSPASFSFAEVIAAAGEVPLPPYIKRRAVADDANRYQTVFAASEGSVAAPTAGLHFTPALLEQLAEKKIAKTFVTLHVGAGTFKPVKAATMSAHEMHAEYIDISSAAIREIRDSLGLIAAVGTTSLRSLESLYWLGVKIIADPKIEEPQLFQWDAYEMESLAEALPAETAFAALLNWMDKKGRTNIFTKTQLLIVPGYRFRIVNILITNFHQPKSTLLLLVAAAVGPAWQKLYDYALAHNFRFLSYGDANLIFIRST